MTNLMSLVFFSLPSWESRLQEKKKECNMRFREFRVGMRYEIWWNSWRVCRRRLHSRISFQKGCNSCHKECTFLLSSQSLMSPIPAESFYPRLSTSYLYFSLPLKWLVITSTCCQNNNRFTQDYVLYSDKEKKKRESFESVSLLLLKDPRGKRNINTSLVCYCVGFLVWADVASYQKVLWIYTRHNITDMKFRGDLHERVRQILASDGNASRLETRKCLTIKLTKA